MPYFTFGLVNHVIMNRVNHCVENLDNLWWGYFCVYSSALHETLMNKSQNIFLY